MNVFSLMCFDKCVSINVFFKGAQAGGQTRDLFGFLLIFSL